MTKQYMDFAPVKRRTVGQSSTTNMQRRTVVTSNAQATAVRKQAVVKPTAKKPITKMPSPTATPRSRIARATSVAKSAQRTQMPSTPTRAVRSVPQSSTNTQKATTSKAESSNTTGLSMSSKVKLGEIEDVNPRFVRTDVPKRPLNDGSEPDNAKATAADAKSKRIGARLRLKKNTSKKNPTPTTSTTVTAEATQAQPKQAAYAVPHTPFINQDKVAKRPLSKNVYRAPANPVAATATNNASSNKTTTIIDKPEKDSRIGMVVAIILTIILGAVAGTVAFLLLPK